MPIPRESAIPDHMEVRMTEKLATKTAMEANAAMSRMMSVICLSILFMFSLCSHLVLLSTAYLRVSYCERRWSRGGSALTSRQAVESQMKNPAQRMLYGAQGSHVLWCARVSELHQNSMILPSLSVTRRSMRPASSWLWVAISAARPDWRTSASSAPKT